MNSRSQREADAVFMQRGLDMLDGILASLRTVDDDPPTL